MKIITNETKVMKMEAICVTHCYPAACSDNYSTRAGPVQRVHVHTSQQPRTTVLEHTENAIKMTKSDIKATHMPLVLLARVCTIKGKKFMTSLESTSKV